MHKTQTLKQSYYLFVIYYFLHKSFITSPAIINPTTDGTKALLPGTCRLCVHFLAVPGGHMQCALQLIASASTVYPPTPPMPNTATQESASFSIASFPSKSSVLENLFNIFPPLISVQKVMCSVFVLISDYRFKIYILYAFENIVFHIRIYFFEIFYYMLCFKPF